MDDKKFELNNNNLEQLKPVSPSCQVPDKEDNLSTIKNNKLMEMLKRTTSTQLKCSMFCGGRKCKYETASAWNSMDKAIPIIYSHWITENILAMARPNMELIEQKNLIGLFKKSNIQTIINLQELNEHAYCGAPFPECSPFSYDPQIFMDNNIYFYNFQWKDYSDISKYTLLNMVKVIAFALKQGKVAIHCHAGLGRTGTLIAAYLIYAYRCKAQDAINFVRNKRPNSIQSRSQISILFKFTNFISPCFIVFSQVSSIQIKTTLEDFLNRQNRLLHGKELRILRYIPKIVFIICEKLLRLSLVEKNKHSREEEFENFTVDYLSYRKSDKIYLNELKNLKEQNENTDEERMEDVFNQQNDLNVEEEELIDSLMTNHVIDSTTFDILNTETMLLNGESFLFENNLFLDPVDEIKIHRENIIKTFITGPELSDNEFFLKLYDYQKAINNKPNGWECLINETDVEILCFLLQSWLESFFIPVLNGQIIAKIKNSKANFIQCFHSLDQPSRYTLEYLARFIIKLTQDQDEQLKKQLMLRFVASLTMCKIKIDSINNELMPPIPKPSWPLLKDNDVIDFFQQLINTIECEQKSKTN